MKNLNLSVYIYIYVYVYVYVYVYTYKHTIYLCILYIGPKGFVVVRPYDLNPKP